MLSEGTMNSFDAARTDFFDQYLAWWQRFLSDGFAWALHQLGQSHDLSWDATWAFVNDYLLLPVVVLTVLVLLLKQTLSD
jgi:hypothetical protein